MQLLKAKGLRHPFSVVRFTPDGSALLTAAADYTVRLWDLATGQVRYEIDRRPAPDKWAVALSPDGKLVATGDGLRLRLWEAAAGQLRHDIPFQHDSPTAITFSPDSRTVLTGTGSLTNPVVFGFDTATAEPHPPWTVTGRFFLRIAFSPDGRRLAMTYRGGTDVLYVATRQRWAHYRQDGHLYPAALAWSPDGRLLASSVARTLTVWDMASGQEVARLEQPKKHFQDAAFSPDGRTLATVSNEATARLWDTATWQERQTFAWAIGQLKCVAFAPDGLRCAAGGDKGAIVVWDADG
jgi:WD40 repeat protein